MLEGIITSGITGGIAGGIAGAMLSYATQKKWGVWKIFFYSFFTFTLLGVVAVHFFFPTEDGFLYDLLLAFAAGTFISLAMLGCYYYAKTRSNK
ncbi:MAG: hypothetical protein DDT26_02545 [Dehalococcoidia bacterium]|nr:hypothetical protein [Chloroflexota bacterium]